MDNENVIQFPTERRAPAEEAGVPQSSSGQAQAAPAEAAAPAGEPFALLSLEIRRLPRADSRIGADVAGRVLNRCVLSSLEVMAKERIPVDLAGTVLRPILEGTFSGADAVSRAARAARAVRDAIRAVQREVELEFHVFGAIATGATSSIEGGVQVTTGSPEQVATRFREHAAPGQILLSEPAARSGGEDVEVAASPVEVTVPGGEPVPAYPLV